MKRRIVNRALLGTLVAALMGPLSPVASAESNWPNGQPVRMVVGFAPGGPTDTVARVIAQQLGSQIGSSIVVVNKPGANGNIAADYVAKAPADGYTFLYNSSSLAVSPAIYSKLPFDLDKDFTYVAATVAMPSVLVVPGDSPAKDFAGWVQLLKEKGRKLNFGTPGVGNSSHLGMEVILEGLGLEATHVPYKGSSEARRALLSGETHFQIDSINTALPLIKEGRIRAVAVLSSKRAVDLPDVPTVSESGVPGFEMDTWQGVAAPAGTPTEVVERMSSELARAIDSPDVKRILAGQGAFSISSTPAEYAEFVAKERDRYIEIVREMEITPGH